MFAWWGRAVVRLRWLVLAIAAAILVLGATWGGGVFGDLISGGFDDPSSPSSKAHSEITQRLGRQDVDIIALYTSPTDKPGQPPANAAAANPSPGASAADQAATGSAAAGLAAAGNVAAVGKAATGSGAKGQAATGSAAAGLAAAGNVAAVGKAATGSGAKGQAATGSAVAMGDVTGTVAATAGDAAAGQGAGVGVLSAEPGKDGAALTAAQQGVAAVAAALKGRAEVTSVTPGPASENGEATYLAIQLRDGDENAKLADLAAIEPVLRAAGPLQVQVGGLIPFLDDANKQISDDITKAEIISLPILLVLLLFIFRGLVAAATPLMVGILAVVGAFVSVRLLAQVTDVSVFAINIITMLGLGMAIDYSLFIVSRFREELAAGRSTPEAIAATLSTAGRTVLVSGLTVALALASLLVFPMDFLKSMAWGGMSAVLVAMLAALTALPALLAVLGPRVNSLRVPLPKLSRNGGGWAKLAHSVMRRPVVYLVGVTGLLLALAFPFLHIEFGGFDERVLPAATESRVVTQRLADEFVGAGGSPISVLVNGPIGDLPERIAAIGNVTVARVAAQRGDATLISVAYRGEPSSMQARTVVKEIRELPGDFAVGGRSAAVVDQLDAFGQRLPWMLLLIVVSTFVLLFLAFGSVVLPLKAMLMNAISIGASFGVVVWVFQEGHLADLLGFTVTGFLEPGNLVLMLAILFGLATDYEVFLLSRVREEWDATGNNSRAVALGLQRTGGIITAAALLLIVVIGGFATGGTATVKLLGVGTVVAVAVDAALVRTLLVPATMRLLGKWNWWAPKPLTTIYRRFGIRES